MTQLTMEQFRCFFPLHYIGWLKMRRIPRDPLLPVLIEELNFIYLPSPRHPMEYIYLWVERKIPGCCCGAALLTTDYDKIGKGRHISNLANARATCSTGTAQDEVHRNDREHNHT